MKFICPLVADTNQNLNGLQVGNIVSSAEEFIYKHLKIDWNINLIITTSMPWLIIPEDGVGGRIYASDL